MSITIKVTVQSQDGSAPDLGAIEAAIRHQLNVTVNVRDLSQEIPCWITVQSVEEEKL